MAIAYKLLGNQDNRFQIHWVKDDKFIQINVADRKVKFVYDLVANTCNMELVGKGKKNINVNNIVSNEKLGWEASKYSIQKLGIQKTILEYDCEKFKIYDKRSDKFITCFVTDKIDEKSGLNAKYSKIPRTVLEYTDDVTRIATGFPDEAHIKYFEDIEKEKSFTESEIRNKFQELFGTDMEILLKQ